MCIAIAIAIAIAGVLFIWGSGHAPFCSQTLCE